MNNIDVFLLSFAIILLAFGMILLRNWCSLLSENINNLKIAAAWLSKMKEDKRFSECPHSVRNNKGVCTVCGSDYYE